MGSRVTGCRYEESINRWSVTCQSDDGVEGVVEADHVVSSAPIRELVKGLHRPVAGGDGGRGSSPLP